ncbi:MAG TPA: lysylphosphatidylglycerol synthase domain-containing protein [Gemmatimonadaceae bacterium]|nr:lysylphosphatidylglycerol synthase domain-containing protein [Gemmatimonadaceae bacterium]
MAPTRRNLFRVAQWIFAAVVLFFAASSLVSQWDRVGSRFTHIQFGWQWIGAATALVLVTYALLIEGWRRVLGAWDSHIPFRPAARIWFLSNLGKYVPGNIWSLTAMGVMAKKRGLSALAASGSSVIMQMVSLATGAGIVIVTSAKLLGQPLLVGAAVTVLVAVLLSAPTFLPPLAEWVGGFIGRDIAPPSVPATSIWTAALASTLSWLFYGLAFQLFVRGLLGTAPGEISSYIAVYTAAYILGFISPIAPAGLGVREFTLAAFMTQLGLANEADAALVAIAARLWLTIVELVPSGLYIAASAKRKSLSH